MIAAKDVALVLLAAGQSTRFPGGNKLEAEFLAQPVEQRGPAVQRQQRIAGFDDFLSRFSAASGIDTHSVGRITPPWTYQLLALLSGLLLIAEIGMVSFGPFGLWGSPNQGLG